MLLGSHGARDSARDCQPIDPMRMHQHVGAPPRVHQLTEQHGGGTATYDERSRTPGEGGAEKDAAEGGGRREDKEDNEDEAHPVAERASTIPTEPLDNHIVMSSRQERRLRNSMVFT
jgi:hypothetical protein